jgi:hypothetical protein
MISIRHEDRLTVITALNNMQGLIWQKQARKASHLVAFKVFLRFWR